MFVSILNFISNHTPLFYWTQSLWRDEAFAVWIAQDSLAEVVRRTSGDFNPPLYYLLLNVWMHVFGRSEVALRGLSVVFFLAFLYVVLKFAQKIFNTRQMVLMAILLQALNPMLLYFAFELRMYSLLVLLATLVMYFTFTQNWPLFIFAATAGMYTQPFMALVILSQSIFLTLTQRFKTAIRNGFMIGLLYVPWIPTLINQFKASGPMWMYPVDLNLVLSALGNLFLGYEGTPGGLWWIMILISFILISISIWLWRQTKIQKQLVGLFFTWLFIPVIFVLGISLIKPIYVHRYLIYTTVAEIFLVTVALSRIKPVALQQFLSLALASLLVAANIWAVSFHRKVNFRKTFSAIKLQLDKKDVIYAGTPLAYYESLYYAPTGVNVFLYNPYHIMPPRYVGSIGMPPEVWAPSYPEEPKRAFLIHDNGEYEIVSQLKPR